MTAASPLSPVARWRNAVRDSSLDDTAKLVAFVVSTYMDAAGDTGGAGDVAGPSKETIARGASLRSVRAVDTAVQRIEAAGLLVVHRSRGRQPNRYLAATPTPHGDARLTPHGDAVIGGGNPAREDAQPRTPVRAKAFESVKSSQSGNGRGPWRVEIIRVLDDGREEVDPETWPTRQEAEARLAELSSQLGPRDVIAVVDARGRSADE